LPPASLHHPTPTPALSPAPASAPGRSFHSLSAASAPALPNVAAPCTPARAAANTAATQPPSPARYPTSPAHCPTSPARCPTFRQSHRLPTTAPHALSPLPVELLHDSPAPLRSHPTRSGSHAPFPADLFAPDTRSVHPPDTALRLLFDINVPLQSRCPVGA